MRINRDMVGLVGLSFRVSDHYQQIVRRRESYPHGKVRTT